MNKQIPSYLRLITDTPNEPRATIDEDRAVIDDVCQAFAASGWRLEWAAGPSDSTSENLMWSAPVNPGVGTAPGHIRLFSTEGRAAAGRISLEAAKEMAGAIAGLWGEVLLTRRALRRREGELAKDVPLLLEGGDERYFDEQLSAVLRAGAGAVGCHAAALYLLDQTTSELKLRASWGLPERRFTDRARPLRGSLADLEALLGHAVVITEPLLFDHWKVPEADLGAAVCVPVSSANMPLGTLWIFSRGPRDFFAHETNVVEVIAGRIVADLERQLLAAEVRKHESPAAAMGVYPQSPADAATLLPPSLEHWDVAAPSQAGPAGPAAFQDWFTRSDESLAILAGSGAAAAAMRAAARACGVESRTCHEILERVNWTLWTTSSGSGGLFCACLKDGESKLQFAAAGTIRVLKIRRRSWSALPVVETLLGVDSEISVRESRLNLASGDVLLVYGVSPANRWTPVETPSAQPAPRDERLARAIQPSLALPAAKLADIAAQVLSEGTIGGAHQLHLAIKHR